MDRRHYLYYWKPDEVADHLREGVSLDHIASGQFAKVAKGDVIWVVTVTDGELRLAGRMEVGRLLAHSALTKSQRAELREADYHAFAARGTKEMVVDVRFGGLADRLRFESAANPRLARDRSGAVPAQQLQSMRELSSPSASLLEAFWAKKTGRRAPAASPAPTLAISIRQPYVEQILRGTKTREFRKGRTHVRGTVYLYASLRPEDDAAGWRSVRKQSGSLPTGVILGTVDIVGCEAPPDREGDFGFVLRNPVRFKRRLKPKGQPQPRFWRPRFR